MNLWPREYVKHGSLIHHPRMSDYSWIFTTTARILFYNNWKENCRKLQMNCSEFHEWLIHLNNTHGELYCPYSLAPDPQNFLNFQQLWVVHHPWVVSQRAHHACTPKGCHHTKRLPSCVILRTSPQQPFDTLSVPQKLPKGRHRGCWLQVWVLLEELKVWDKKLFLLHPKS